MSARTSLHLSLMASGRAGAATTVSTMPRISVMRAAGAVEVDEDEDEDEVEAEAAQSTITIRALPVLLTALRRGDVRVGVLLVDALGTSGTRSTTARVLAVHGIPRVTRAWWRACSASSLPRR